MIHVHYVQQLKVQFSKRCFFSSASIVFKFKIRKKRICLLMFIQNDQKQSSLSQETSHDQSILAICFFSYSYSLKQCISFIQNISKSALRIIFYSLANRLNFLICQYNISTRNRLLTRFHQDQCVRCWIFESQPFCNANKKRG